MAMALCFRLGHTDTFIVIHWKTNVGDEDRVILLCVYFTSLGVGGEMYKDSV